MTLHGISETDYPSGLLLADKVARADFVACASWFMRAQAMRVAAPGDWPKLHLVRCGVDLAAMPPVPPRADGPVIFVAVGRLSSEKGHRGLLEAFAAVRRQAPDARLDLVGGGPLAGELAALAELSGLAGAVRFHGALSEPDTLKVIAGADVLVLTSFMEGLPMVILEALALGKAVVSSGVAGIPELVENGRSGLLVAPSNWPAFAEAMLALAGDPALRARLGAAGREAVVRDFAIDRAVQPLLALFSGQARSGSV